jgi:O-antigen ligase
LTIFWAPFFLFPVELYKFAFPMSEILIGLTFGAWLLHLLTDWGRRHNDDTTKVARLRKISAVDYGVGLWLVLGILSLLWSEQVSLAVTELRAMIVEPFLFYLVLRESVRDKLTAIRLVDGLLLAGFVVALIGLLQFIQGQALISAEDGATRLAGVYGSPNNLALFLGRSIPFALAYMIIGSDHVRRFFAGIILFVMLIAVILTQSVGAIFLGVPVSIAVVFLLIWRRGAGLALLALSGVIALISPFLFQSARFSRLLDFSSGTNFFRIRVWQSAINMIRDHPLTGIGLDQFLYAFRGQYIMPDAPHNFALDFWLRLGILGLLNFVWLQVAFWRVLRSNYYRFRADDPLLCALCIGAAGSMANLLSHGLVDNSVFVQDLCYVYILLLGLVVNLSNIRTIDESHEIMV